MNQTTQLWPLKPGDDKCPYCQKQLNIVRKIEGMYLLECRRCDERFITEADLFDRMMAYPRGRKKMREWPM